MALISIVFMKTDLSQLLSFVFGTLGNKIPKIIPNKMYAIVSHTKSETRNAILEIGPSAKASPINCGKKLEIQIKPTYVIPRRIGLFTGIFCPSI